MKINIDLDTENAQDLAALTALVAALGGRAPEITPAARPAPPPPPSADASRSGDMLAAEAARVAAERSGAAQDDDDEGGEPAEVGSLDANGIPWDERIHAGTKTQNKDKTWKKKKNVDEVFYGQVFAELQERHGGNAQRPAAPPPPPATTAAPPPPPATENARTAPPPPNAGAATGGGRFADFPSFVQAVNATPHPTVAGKQGMSYVELNDVASTLGVPGGFKDMKDRADLWDTFYGMVGGQ